MENYKLMCAFDRSIERHEKLIGLLWTKLKPLNREKERGIKYIERGRECVKEIYYEHNDR